MQIKAIKTRVFKENEDLVSFILKYIKKLPENSVLVVTSKIIALSEGRTVEFKNEKQRSTLIKRESSLAVKTKYKNVWFTLKDGMVMPNAGIDGSNAKGKLILLPKNSFKSAEIIRTKLKKVFKVKNLGILISDSRVFPLRAGVVGVALGYAGFKGVRAYRGKKDIFGRVLKISRTNLADGLATSAVVSMGEGKEQQPLALIKDAPVEFAKKVNKKELSINIKEDLYLPLFRSILKK